MTYEEKEHKQEILDEMVENYEAVKKLGKWAVGSIVFIGALVYAILQFKRLFK